MLKILQSKNKILRQKSHKILLEEIHSTEIQLLLTEMKTILSKYKEGVALAAPQIGKSLRLFIVSKKILEKDGLQKFVYINPEIIKISKEKKWMEEGCLSLKNTFGEVERATKCTIKAYDENGKLFTKGSSKLLSQIFQHEIDHLDGILFTDKARNIKKLP